MIKTIEYQIKHNQTLQRIYKVLFSAFFRFIGFFLKIDEKQMLFFSMSGRSFGDSPRVLFDAISQDDFFKGYKLVWAFENPEDFSEFGLNTVKLNSFSYFTTALRSTFCLKILRCMDYRGMIFCIKQILNLRRI